jgi:amino acid adenylation domain-containing protein
MSTPGAKRTEPDALLLASGALHAPDSNLCDCQPEQNGENHTSTPYPANSTLPELFARQVRSSPNNIALEFGDRKLTYSELDARANRLASYLRCLGVTPGTLVGICQERSLDMIVSLLAILKTGAAYVPLDANYPTERMGYILKDARAPVLLVNRAQHERMFRFHASSRLVCVDELFAIAGEDCETGDPGIKAGDPAYVMYTSGSTGSPKGVMVPHRAVVRLVKNTNYFEAGPNQVFLQLAPVSFDASTFEIWGALLNGSRLAIMPPETPSIDALARAIQEYGVTTLWLTAGLFHLVVDERIDALRPLRQLLAGGDVLSPSHVVRALEQLRLGARLINGYGPTESTTFACCHVMFAGEQVTGSVPIGRPISNTQVYLLDKDLAPVPMGDAGEICIGGDGLALGYLNDPALTQRKFVPNPFSDEPNGRLYRTGDLGRRRKDGVIEFLGRIDNQVKINGHRIEPGEIECVLGRHPQVSGAAVAIRTGPRGQKQLIAYVVVVAQGITSLDLRNYLKLQLPDYMLPSGIVLVESLPLSPNGKVDRNALASLEPANSEVRRSVPLRTAIRQQILEIWSKVLGTEQRGLDENFFDAGGDSLQLIEVHSALEKLLNIKIPITDLFEHTTINSISRHLADRNAGALPVDKLQERANKQNRAMIHHGDRARQS